MTAVLVSAPTTKPCLSEIFPLEITELKSVGFRLSPSTDREGGQRLSFRFSRQFPHVVVAWYEGTFYASAAQTADLPSTQEWQEALARIQVELALPDKSWSFQWVRSPRITPAIAALLAEQILKVTRPFTSPSVLSEALAEVKRRAEFGAETFELEGVLKPALTLSAHSSILFRGTLATFFDTHPYRHDPQKLLVGLKVEDIDSGSIATIVALVGTMAEYREKLKAQASGATSRQALEEAPDDQPVVGVQFSKTSKTIYHYAMAALRPSITAETADPLNLDFGALLKATKIPYQERQGLLKQYREAAVNALKRYGIQLKPPLNGGHHPELFWEPSIPTEETQLLFGQDVRSTYSKILNGLSGGGVYFRHPDYQTARAPGSTSAQSRPIRIAVLNLLKQQDEVNQFLKSVQQRLQKYKFDSVLLDEQSPALALDNPSDTAARAGLDEALDQLMVVPPDIMFVFLPQSDRTSDDEDSGSLYHRIYSRLIRRHIASQVIYEQTLKKVQSSYLLNQVIPGVLAKLGNLPFVLAEPLAIADCFVGLDVSRVSKKRLAGSMNACAGVCLYGSRGEFIRSRSEDAAIEGEEIPQKFLEALLPAADLRGKTVLIYRDGRFCGDEVANLLRWAAAINAKFILVECRKSGVPRLYKWIKGTSGNSEVTAPDKGLALRLSEREAILVTTQVDPKIGLARPLRLTIHPEGHPAAVDQVLEATLKLTLLHHGALKPPRLPMLLHGADRLAELRLNGVYVPECDRQFWL